MNSIEKQIHKQIHKRKRGKLIFPEDFIDIGSSEAVRLALHRLNNNGLIKRVAQGIYVRPVINDYIGEVLPTAEEVAEGIAQRDKIRIVPTGTYALNALGLSTQMPMNIVLLTDGSPRTIKVGKRTIKFKKTTPKNLLAKGKISRLAIQALKEIGKDKLTEEEEKNIVSILKKENKSDLKHDILLAPVWIQKILKKALHSDGN